MRLWFARDIWRYRKMCFDWLNDWFRTYNKGGVWHSLLDPRVHKRHRAASAICMQLELVRDADVDVLVSCQHSIADQRLRWLCAPNHNQLAGCLCQSCRCQCFTAMQRISIHCMAVKHWHQTHWNVAVHCRPTWWPVPNHQLVRPGFFRKIWASGEN